jgi:hypothetical protein
MRDIEKKAMALLNASEKKMGLYKTKKPPYELPSYVALYLSIEQHEAFKQEVSDAVADAKFMIETHCDEEASTLLNNRLSRFIIPAPKPDPLVEVLGAVDADRLRAALKARGLEIREKGA